MDWQVVVAFLLGLGFIYVGIKSIRTKSITSWVLLRYRTIKGPLAIFLGFIVTLLGFILFIPSLLAIIYSLKSV